MRYALPRKRLFSPMIKRPECPWCVRVTCMHGRDFEPRCGWSGYRPKGDHHRPCPSCGTAVGPFRVATVHHSLSVICPRRRFAKGAGPS